MSDKGEGYMIDLSQTQWARVATLIDAAWGSGEILDYVRERVRRAYERERRAVKDRIALGNYTDCELRYSATARCKCGAGLAYPKNMTDVHGEWICSEILKNPNTGPSSDHQSFPFSLYEIKSEDQPSANGATTRPYVNDQAKAEADGE